MTAPKKAPCPKCGAPGESLGLYRYENGWQHVECDRCHYFGPGAGNALQAVREHNASAKAEQSPSDQGVEG